MTAKQIEKIIHKKGWYFVKQKGSHKIFKHEEISGLVVIPFHGKRDLPVGTLNSIFKKAQVKK